MSGSNAIARQDIDFDVETFSAWLATQGITGAMEIERLGGGQSNPTYFVTVGERRMVLRKKPQGDLPKSAHDVGREYRIISALDGSPVPVPQPILSREEPDVVGTAFYLMARVDGHVFHDAALPSVPVAERKAYYREFAHVLARLHAFDWRPTDLAAFARPGSFLTRQVDRWIRAWGDAATTDTEVKAVGVWLRANIPAHEEVTIVHGDFKFTNVIFDAKEPKLAAILDWELCAIGDPLADVAHFWSAMWETRPEEYGGIMGLDFAALGLPTAEEFFDYYYEAAASDARLTPFHKVLGHFRNAGIFHGIAERAASGNANAANAAEIGKLDRVYLRRALAIVEQNHSGNTAA